SPDGVEGAPADGDAGLPGGEVSAPWPVAIGGTDSLPVTRGAVGAVVTPHEGTGRSSSRRITEGVKDALGDGVTKIGSGLGTIGGGVSRLGEKSRKVPLVGSSVAALGESISSVGESLTDLPRVARTRHGRLLVRSVVVAFLLVASWIVVIVGLQVRGTDAPDFRPNAEKILIELSNGPASIGQVFEAASPRFQEFVSKEQFVESMTDLHSTAGKFKEITAVNESLVTSGPNGRIGRVSLTVAYEKGKTKASVSLHSHEGVWKLLGIGVEVPPAIEISQAQREERVQACKDPMDPKRCDVFVAANKILEQLRDGRAGEVWDGGDEIFQQQEDKQRWVQIQAEHATALGDYRRILRVTEAKMYDLTLVHFDVLIEYARSNGVRAIFGFSRKSRTEPWRLRSLKRVLPMPRADEPAPIRPVEPAIGGRSGGGPGSARR
nr:DUF3887 domain-containing protein [Myxococcota bacterium]